MANKNIHTARIEKNDEFYTQLSDIEAELSNYSDKFQGKVVFCNCDDPFKSNFVKYFLMNFNRLGLKELIATGYKTSPIIGGEIGTKGTPYVLRVTDTSKYLVGTQTDLDNRGVKYFLETEGFHETEGSRLLTPLVGNPAVDKNGKPVQIDVKVPVLDENGEPVLDKKGKPKMKTVKQDLYYEAGDFRSDMSIELLKQSDIVCTNPAFSLFREYVAQLMEYQKQFLIIGNMNAVTYKEVFPLIKENKVWYGPSISSGDRKFYVPNSYPLNAAGCGIDENGRRYIRVKGVRWFTNLDHKRRHNPLVLTQGYALEKYHKYDNYDAINVDKTCEIPYGYTGVMGVPITFLDKYCPEQFEILGCSANPECNSLPKSPRSELANQLIKKNRLIGAKCVGGNSNLYIDKDDYVHVLYHRIFIRFKDAYVAAHPEQFRKIGKEGNHYDYDF